MYAIIFDLDADTLQRIYSGDSWRDAYAEVRRILLEEGFSHQQGAVYFGNLKKIDAVAAIMAAERLAEELPWFAESVREFRMLRIEEVNDLRPLLNSARRRTRFASKNSSLMDSPAPWLGVCSNQPSTRSRNRKVSNHGIRRNLRTGSE